MTEQKVFLTTKTTISLMATEIPTIEHPQDCSCSFCARPSSYGYTFRPRNADRRPVTEVVSLEDLVFKVCLIVAISLFCFGFYSYFFSSNSSDIGVSIYYQDLNTVEIRQFPGNEISPELISKIHHFQERPFGLPGETLSDRCLGGVLKLIVVLVFLISLISKIC